MKKTFIVILLFIALINKSIAQRAGYIITKKGDTIYCDNVKTTFLGSKPKYKVKATDDFKEISTDDIVEYRLSSDSSIYITKALSLSNFINKLKIKVKFVKWLERGKINFYQMADNGDVYWFANKNNDSLQCLRIDYYRGAINSGNNKRKKIFIEMISDQPSLLALFKSNNDYDAETIQVIIKNYNYNSK